MTEKDIEDLYYQSCEEVPEHSSRGIFKEKVFSLKLFAQNVEAYVKSQRTWVGLTDKEYSFLAEEFTGADGLDEVDYGRAIEAKLKEKNT
jgi:hypothetical protein